MISHLLKHFFMRPVRRLRAELNPSREDIVIAELLAGDPDPFIEYFSLASEPFVDIDHRRQISAGGRVVYENDIYSYVYIDGVPTNRLRLQLPYEARTKLVERIDQAVMSNAFGTTYYEQRHFGRKVDA